MFSDVPLVSAIMPTRGRPEMARRALECFTSQTWPNRELVIVDDRDQPSFSGANLPNNVHYIVNQQRMTVGAKRNMAVSRAHGEIIVHFDSDDWSAPERIEDQATRLLASDYEITGYNSMYFTDGQEWWIYSGALGYALGTSLMYRRGAWKARPFQDRQISEDTAFIDGRRVLAVPANDLMVAWQHAGNTVTDRREFMMKHKRQYTYLGVVA